MAGLKIRRATIFDWARLLDWRNEPSTRAASLNTEPVAVQDHMKWLTKTLESPTTVLLVAEDSSTGAAVGTFRLDCKKDHDVEISVSVDRRMRGQGFAVEMLSRVVEHMPPEWKPRKIVARIRSDNYASMRSFSRVGFQYARTDKDVVVMNMPVLGANDGENHPEI